MKNIKDMESIKYDKRNYRKHNDKNKKLIEHSLQECGAGRSILLDNEDSIVAGNGVYEQASKLGIPVRIVETDGKELIAVKRTDINSNDEKRRHLAVMDNKTSDTSEFDYEMLSEDFELEDLEIMGFDVDDFEIEENEPEGDEDEVPEIDETKEPITKLGDLYEIGSHRLLCGDCIIKENIDKLMDGKKADMVLTDPPYNVDYEGGTKEKLKIDNDNKSDEEFLQFLSDAYLSFDSSLKEGGVFYIWHAESESFNFRYAAKITKWKVRQCLIWNKSQIVFGRQDYHWKHEPCLYGWKDGAAHYWGNDRKQKTVIDFDKPLKNGVHPTMKPVGLLEYQIKNSSKQNEIVLDLFLGSGSTMVAAEKTSRICFGTELDEHYCDVIVTRMHNAYPDLIIKKNGEEIQWGI